MTVAMITMAATTPPTIVPAGDVEAIVDFWCCSDTAKKVYNCMIIVSEVVLRNISFITENNYIIIIQAVAQGVL